MQVMDVWDAMVVVTRWYGGVQLGPRRFALINAVARDGLVKAGLVKEEKQEKKKGK
jgi:putative IMPACT (imprinted ancient) family translation regulator